MTDQNGEVDKRVRLEPQLLLDRSRASGFDLLKLLVTQATAGVAGYFATLTQVLNPPLQSDEIELALIALSCMVAAVFAGLLGWTFDARYYERWAQSLQKELAKGPLWKARQTSNRIRFLGVGFSAIFFIFGIIISGIFAYARSERIIFLSPIQRW